MYLQLTMYAIGYAYDTEQHNSSQSELYTNKRVLFKLTAH